jgi:hypothetical protein
MFKYFIVSFYLVLFYLASLFVGRYVYALDVNDLYQASVHVDSQGREERKDALKQAMQAVMLKVGGQLSVLDNGVLKKALKTANTFITQYHYQEINQPAKLQNELLTEKLVKRPTKKQLSLVVSFNEDKINKLFYQANLPIWGSLRPQILLWLIDEQGVQRRIISNSRITDTADIDFSSLANRFSEQRGLPILMPLMDFDDVTQITVSDLWGRFEQPIRSASARYLPEAIVVMRVSNSSLVALNESVALGNTINGEQDVVNYVLDWTLLSPQVDTNKQPIGEQYQGMDKASVFQQGLADITETIYQHYALSTERDNSIVIEVANIESLAVYTELFNFLTDLSSIKSVTLISATGKVRRFNLQLLGSKDALLATLKLNQRLKQYIDPLIQADDSAPPIFHWEQR